MSTRELYFDWLFEQVRTPRDRPSMVEKRICRLLFQKDFIWFVSNDDNRAEDGKQLRHTFIEETFPKGVDPDWHRENCNMLEMMVGLCFRLSFESDEEPSIWFWRLMRNIGADNFDPSNWEGELDEALDRVLWRTYSHDGKGGFFPLKAPSEDQRQIEIWYQMSAYLLEQNHI